MPLWLVVMMGLPAYGTFQACRKSQSPAVGESPQLHGTLKGTKLLQPAEPRGYIWYLLFLGHRKYCFLVVTNRWIIIRQHAGPPCFVSMCGAFYCALWVLLGCCSTRSNETKWCVLQIERCWYNVMQTLTWRLHRFWVVLQVWELVCVVWLYERMSHYISQQHDILRSVTTRWIRRHHNKFLQIALRQFNQVWTKWMSYVLHEAFTAAASYRASYGEVIHLTVEHPRALNTWRLSIMVKGIGRSTAVLISCATCSAVVADLYTFVASFIAVTQD